MRGEGLECVRHWSCDHSDALRRLRTQDAVSALQFEGFFATAQVVDEVAQLVDVLQTLRHDHLLVHQVGLGQVGAGLDTHTAGSVNTGASGTQGQQQPRSYCSSSRSGAVTLKLMRSSRRSLGGMTTEVLRGMM